MEIFLESDYIRSALFLVAAFITAQVITFIVDHYIQRIVKRTSSDLDDKAVAIVRSPISTTIYLLGSYLAIRSISIFQQYDLWIDRIFYAAIVIVIASVFSKLLSLILGKWLKVENGYKQTPRLVTKMVSLIIYSIGIMMILRFNSVEISPLIATLGIGGLAIGLALQPTLSNFFSGLFIISDKPVNVGDFVELTSGGLSGYVEDIGWRTTRIRTLPNTLVIVPNSKLADSIIVNNSLPNLEMGIAILCGVAYGSDLDKVESVTIDVARSIQQTVEGAVSEFEPGVRFNSFGDSNINFKVLLRVRKFEDQYLVIHEFIKALASRYETEAIDISWPVRKIYQAA